MVRTRSGVQFPLGASLKYWGDRVVEEDVSTALEDVVTSMENLETTLKGTNELLSQLIKTLDSRLGEMNAKINGIGSQMVKKQRK